MKTGSVHTAQIYRTAFNAGATLAEVARPPGQKYGRRARQGGQGEARRRSESESLTWLKP